jgi:hypothetical protein
MRSHRFQSSKHERTILLVQYLLWLRRSLRAGKVQLLLRTCNRLGAQIFLPRQVSQACSLHTSIPTAPSISKEQRHTERWTRARATWRTEQRVPRGVVGLESTRPACYPAPFSLPFGGSQWFPWLLFVSWRSLYSVRVQVALRLPSAQEVIVSKPSVRVEASRRMFFIFQFPMYW